MNYEKKLSEESGSIFSEGIVMTLYRWSALQLAVENEWGGRQSRQKAEQLHSDIFSWFTQSTGNYQNSLILLHENAFFFFFG